MTPADRAELDALSSHELHDRAVDIAKHKLDVGFFWRLLKSVPAAEASIGDIDEAENDITTLLGRLNDLKDSGEGELADALRPLYIEYLQQHS